MYPGFAIKNNTDSLQKIEGIAINKIVYIHIYTHVRQTCVKRNNVQHTNLQACMYSM